MALGRAVESLQKVGQEKGLSTQDRGRDRAGPSGHLCLPHLYGGHFSAPYSGTVPGLHSCQQHLGGKLDKHLGCHETWKLCAQRPAHGE